METYKINSCMLAFRKVGNENLTQSERKSLGKFIEKRIATNVFHDL